MGRAMGAAAAIGPRPLYTPRPHAPVQDPSSAARAASARAPRPPSRPVNSEVSLDDSVQGRRLLPHRRSLLRRGEGRAADGPRFRERESDAHDRRLRGPRGVPARAGPGVRAPRAARSEPLGLRVRGPQQRRLRAHPPGAGARRLGHPLVRLGAGRSRHVPGPRVRLGGTEEEVASAARARREDRVLRPHGAGLRLESLRHEDARADARTIHGANPAAILGR